MPTTAQAQTHCITIGYNTPCAVCGLIYKADSPINRLPYYKEVAQVIA